MFVYEAGGKNLLEDFVTYRFHDLHPDCGRRVQKLRADEVFRVPQFVGANIPVVPEKLKDSIKAEDIRQRHVIAERAAMMKMMLFMPMQLPLSCRHIDEAAVLDMLGARAVHSQEGLLAYEPTWSRWFGQQRLLADTFKMLQERAGKIFTLDDINLDRSVNSAPSADPEQPSAAEAETWKPVD